MQSKLAELLHRYFELGVAEGREGRKHDTDAGDAQRVLSEIEAEIAKMNAEIKRLTRVAADRQYMMWAYASMMGPKGLEVIAAWDKKGVQRFHADWGPDAGKLTGEERAQVLLDAHNQIEAERAEAHNGN